MLKIPKLSRLKEIAGSLVSASREKFGDGEFEAGVSKLLAAHDMDTARMVGDLYKFTDQTRQNFRDMRMPLEWDQGAVFVSDIPGDDGVVTRAYALMIGKTLEGDFEIKSVYNMARPDDFVTLEKDTARRIANRYRDMLKGHHEIVAPQAEYLFTPSATAEAA